jgi:copper(I)-binding protein
LKHFVLAALLAPAFANAGAQLVVKDAWVRPTVPQQEGTGAFIQLTASETTRLVEVRASIAGAAELHEMSLDNDVTRMHRAPGMAICFASNMRRRPRSN